MLKVNATYPDDTPLPTTPPQVLMNLPKLPEQLEYRIVGKNLIIRDVAGEHHRRLRSERDSVGGRGTMRRVSRVIMRRSLLFVLTIVAPRWPCRPLDRAGPARVTADEERVD